MKYIIINNATGKQAPAIDFVGNEHWEPLPLKQAAKAVAYLNKRLGANKAYRLEAL